MKYYFNLVNGNETIIDEEGIEVRDLDQALVQAMKAIEELRAEEGAEAEAWENWSLEVTDSSGTVLLSLALSRSLH